MDPRKKPEDDEVEAPTIEQQNWDSFEGDKILPDSVTVEEGASEPLETESTLPEEDDDNPYQESDEALPDDEEEKVLSRDPSKEGSRFDEV